MYGDYFCIDEKTRDPYCKFLDCTWDLSMHGKAEF